MTRLQAPVDSASRCITESDEEASRATPEPATTEPPTMLLAQISRKVGQRMGLGVNWSSSVNHLVVTKLEPGLVKRLNKAKKQGEQIAVGDLIVDVNGEQGNDKMLALLANSTIVDLDITFMKHCGEAPCDNPELRAELQSVLPEYRIVWPSVASVLMERVESCGLLKQSVQHSFRATLLPSGMLHMADAQPKHKGAKHQREFARVSTLVALVGDRESLRRKTQEPEKAEPLVEQPPAWSPSLGDPVEGRYLNGRFYKAIVEEDHGNGKYRLKWVDGDTMDCVKSIQDLREPTGDWSHLKQPPRESEVDSREQQQQQVPKQPPREGEVDSREQQQQQVPNSSATTSSDSDSSGLDSHWDDLQCFDRRRLLGPRGRGSIDKTTHLEEGPDMTPSASDTRETMLSNCSVAQIPKRHVQETSRSVDMVLQSGPISDMNASWAANNSDAHPFMGAVGRGADSPTRSQGSQNMRALAESHKKGNLSQNEFQQAAAAVFGWDLQAV